MSVAPAMTSGSAATSARWSRVQWTCEGHTVAPKAFAPLEPRRGSCRALGEGPQGQGGPMNAKVDHLAVVADTLEQGARWCEETFGVAPIAGGKHPLMGTHNCLLAISSERFPATYLEVIAIDPDAP